MELSSLFFRTVLDFGPLPAPRRTWEGVGNHVISDRVRGTHEGEYFLPQICTVNPVGMSQCAETALARFSAHVGRLHAHLY